MERGNGIHFLGILLSSLVLAEGCAPKSQALRPAGTNTKAEIRVPPAEAIGIRLQDETRQTLQSMLPLTEADKTGARTPATPGVGWIVLIEVNVFVSPAPRIQEDRGASVEMP